MLEVEQSITTPLEHLEFVVQAFYKAAIFSPTPGAYHGYSQ
jgi:hypothetical protein